MEYPGAPAAGIPEEEEGRGGRERWRGILGTMQQMTSLWVGYTAMKMGVPHLVEGGVQSQTTLHGRVLMHSTINQGGR